MDEILLEKIDAIRERVNVSFKDAKQALEVCDGNVVEAILYLENTRKVILVDSEKEELSKQELLEFIKSLIRKGNINRIRVKHNEKILVDIPINAGIVAVGVLTYYLSVLAMAIGVVAAIVTNITIEITKNDGSIEIVNKKVKDTFSDMKNKVENVATGLKDKFNRNNSKKMNIDNSQVYTYTVNFKDEENIEHKEENKEN
jgi:hypothetical protein